VTTPLIKWPGGKARQIDALSDAIGKVHGTYYEPFLGSGAVYLGLRERGLVDRAVLSDVNERLIDVHREVRDDPEMVIRILSEYPTENWRSYYYALRESFNAGNSLRVVCAARMIWLNHACFNGLYRENRRGEFNASAGDYERVNLPTPEHIREVFGLLRGASIECRDFRESLQAAGAGDVAYCDPPYLPLTDTANFSTYSKDGFLDGDQCDLAWEAQQAARRGARVMISNHDTPRARAYYAAAKGFRLIRSVLIRRSISCKGATRAPVAEGLWVIGETSGEVSP
jgi:DNA adenine methylase